MARIVRQISLLDSKQVGRGTEFMANIFTNPISFRAMSQLKAVLGKMRDRNPDVLFTRNLERLDENGQLYDLGQLCAMSLWTLTGDLRSTKKDSPEV